MEYLPYPGTPLRVGSSGAAVSYIQSRLTALADVYTAINHLTVDSKYGTNTKNAVTRFQKQFGLSADGVVGQNTWTKVNVAYEALSGMRVHVTTPYPGYVVQQGASGDNVRFVQSYVSAVGSATGQWSPVTVDGKFGTNTRNAVTRFQVYVDVNADGKVGSITWGQMVPRFNGTL